MTEKGSYPYNNVGGGGSGGGTINLNASDPTKVLLTGDTMTGTLNMGNNAIKTTYVAVDPEDVINKAFVPDVSGFVLKAGDTMTGDLTITAPSHAIATQAPSAGGHLTNKTYVDNLVAGKVLRSGDTMTGNLNMGANLMTNVANPAAPADAVNLQSMNTALGTFLPKAGGTMTGNLVMSGATINMGSNRITGLTNPPANPTDAASKDYVDDTLDLYLPLTGGTLSGALTVNGTLSMTGAGNIDMGGTNKVVNIAAGVASTDGARMDQLTGIGTFLPLTGGTVTPGNIVMTGGAEMRSNSIQAQVPASPATLFTNSTSTLTVGGASMSTMTVNAGTLDIVASAAVNIGNASSAPVSIKTGVSATGVVSIGGGNAPVTINGTPVSIATSATTSTVNIATDAGHNGQVSIGGTGATQIVAIGGSTITVGGSLATNVDIASGVTSTGNVTIGNNTGTVTASGATINVGTNTNAGTVNIANNSGHTGAVSIGNTSNAAQAITVGGMTIDIGTANTSSAVNIATTASHAGTVNIGSATPSGQVVNLRGATVNVGLAPVAAVVHIADDATHTGSVTIGNTGTAVQAVTLGGSTIAIGNANPATTVSIADDASHSGNVTILNGAEPTGSLLMGGQTITIGNETLASVIAHLFSSTESPAGPPGAVTWTTLLWSESELRLIATGSADHFASQPFAYSSDGTTWTVATTEVAIGTMSWTVAYSPQLARYVAVSSTGLILNSTTTGTTWATVASLGSIAWTGVAWSPLLSTFVAVSNDAIVMRSSTGTSAWTSLAVTPTNSTSVIWVPELFVFVSTSSSAAGIAVSSDGIVWTTVTIPGGTVAWSSVAYSPTLSLLVAVNTNNLNVATTSNPLSGWTTSASLVIGKQIVWSVSLSAFIVVGTGTPSLQYSTNGLAWTTPTFSDGVVSVAWSNNDHRAFLMNSIGNTIRRTTTLTAPQFNQSTSIGTPAASTVTVSGKNTTVTGTRSLTLASSVVNIGTTSPDSAVNIANAPTHSGNVNILNGVGLNSGAVGAASGSCTIGARTIVAGFRDITTTAEVTSALATSSWTTTTVTHPVVTSIASGTLTNGVVKFVALNQGGGGTAFVTSTNGKTWAAGSPVLPVSLAIQKVHRAHTFNSFVAVSSTSSQTLISTDGNTWTVGGALPLISLWTDVVSSNSNIVAVCNSASTTTSIAITSSLAVLWTGGVTLPSVRTWSRLCYAYEVDTWVAISSSGGAAAGAVAFKAGAPAGTWTAGTLFTGTFGEVAWSPSLGIFVTVNATAATPAVAYSTGSTPALLAGAWLSADPPGAAQSWAGLIWIDELRVFFATAASSSTFMWSSNGSTWTMGTLPISVTQARAINWNPTLSILTILSTSGTSQALHNVPDAFTRNTQTVSVGARSVTDVTLHGKTITFNGMVDPYASSNPFFYGLIDTLAVAQAAATCPLVFNSSIVTNGFAFSGNLTSGYNSAPFASQVIASAGGTAQGAYTAPLTGLYMVTGGVLTLATAITCTINVHINSTATSAPAKPYSVQCVHAAGTRQFLTWRWLIPMKVGDKMQISALAVNTVDKTAAFGQTRSFLSIEMTNYAFRPP